MSIKWTEVFFCGSILLVLTLGIGGVVALVVTLSKPKR